MSIPFTDREMQKAWRDNKSVYDNSDKKQRKNAHRLLLFYAVECGLKAILMHRQEKGRTDLCQEIRECKHNINKLLDSLHAGSNLKLPAQLNMTKIPSENSYDERKFTPGSLNQMWRYGGVCATDGITDEDLENKLLEIANWIEEELSRP